MNLTHIATIIVCASTLTLNLHAMEKPTVAPHACNTAFGTPITQDTILGLYQAHNPTPHAVQKRVDQWLAQPATLAIDLSYETPYQQSPHTYVDVDYKEGTRAQVIQHITTLPDCIDMQRIRSLCHTQLITLNMNNLSQHMSSGGNIIIPIMNGDNQPAFWIKASGPVNKLFHLVSEHQDPYYNGGVQAFNYRKLDPQVRPVHTLTRAARALQLQEAIKQHTMQHVIVPNTYLFATNPNDDGTFIIQEHIAMDLLEQQPQRCQDIPQAAFPELVTLAKIGALWNLGRTKWGCKLGITPHNQLVVFNTQDPNNIGPQWFYNQDLDRCRANTVTGIEEFSYFLRQTYDNPAYRTRQLAATLTVFKRTLEDDPDFKLERIWDWNGKRNSIMHALSVENL